MKYQIDERDYWAAIDQALQHGQAQGGSTVAEGLTNLLAQVWDTSVPVNAVEILQMLDDRTRQLAFDLIVGRSLHGRPTRHPHRNKIEALSTEVSCSFLSERRGPE